MPLVTAFVWISLMGIQTSLAQNFAVAKPVVGSLEYKKLLNAIRPRVEYELKTAVKFVVKKMNVMGEWAYLEVLPKQQNGKPIDYSKTKFKHANLDIKDPHQASMLTNYVLLKKVDGRWFEIRQESFQILANINWSEYFPVKHELFGYE